MARPRTNRTPEQLGDPDAGIDTDALAATGQALAMHGQHVSEIEHTYGIDMPYHLDLYVARIRQHAAESAARLIEIGRMLIVVRERESREIFADVLDRCGMAVRFAQRAMQAAIKLQDRDLVQQLGVSKALELLSEDDDTLDEFEGGGTLAGKTFDELDRMSVRELKATLRAERAERDAEKSTDEDIIRAKDERINKLTRERKRRDSETELRAKADDLLRDADEAAVEATSQIHQLRRLCTDIDQLYAEAGLTVDPEVAERLEQNQRWAADQLSQLADDLGE